MGVSRLWNRTPMILRPTTHACTSHATDPTPHPHPTQHPIQQSKPAGAHRTMPPSPVHHAAAMGRLGQVQAMLHEDPSLLNAIHRGREDASGDPSDWAGSTPLVLAARYNQVGVCADDVCW